jgi:hypothetical protein
MPATQSDATFATEHSSDDPLDREALESIRLALRGLRYGQVVVVVQDGIVIQVDRTERRRLRLSGPRGH